MTLDAFTRDGDGDARDAARLAPVARGRKALAYCLLAVVMGAVAAMSWSGLYAFARVTMHWSPGHAVLVPVALDVAAITCAFLALDSLSRNDSAFMFRLLTAALVALSAFVNWRRALLTGNIAEQVFFPAMSLLSYGLIDAVLRKYRVDTRRERMGLPVREAYAPLPRVGPAVWFRYPGRAWAAVSRALADRVPDAATSSDATRRGDYAAGLLDGLSQADAIRRAMEVVGAEPRQVIEWLAERGRPNVAPQRVYDVIRRDRDQGKHARPGVLQAVRTDDGDQAVS